MDTRVKRIIVALCVADVLIIAVLGILISGPFSGGDGGRLDAESGRPGPDGASSSELASRLKLLSERNASLEKELARAREEISCLRAEDPRAAGKSGTGGGLPASADPGANAGSSAAPGLEEGAKRKPTFEALAEKMLKLAALAPKEGDPPTPEFMRAVGELMSEVSGMQAELGLDDPGFVTESPAFKAKLAAKALEQAGFPLDPGLAISLESGASKAMEAYLADAKRKEGDFALDRTSRVLKDIEEYDDELGRLVDTGRIEDSPFFGAHDEEEDPAQATKWPVQSSIGVKDLDEAADKISEKWKSAMGIPESGVPLLEAVVRDFVQRSDSAAQRAGASDGAVFDQRRRRDLDHEIASCQIEALRRLHDAFGSDEAAGRRIREYNCLERFEPGGTSTWMRSGSFGGFKVQSSSKKSSGDRAQTR